MYGERIKLLRTEKKLTQAQLAEAIGLGNKVSTLRAWELEYSQPGISDIINLSDYFGVTIDFLLGRSTDRGNRDVQEIEKNIYALNRGAYTQALEDVNSLFWSSVNPLYVAESIKRLSEFLQSQVLLVDQMKRPIEISLNAYQGDASARVHSPVEEIRKNDSLIAEFLAFLRDQFYSALDDAYSSEETVSSDINPDDPNY